jgi:hypothetical protein
MAAVALHAERRGNLVNLHILATTVIEQHVAFAPEHGV